MIGQDATPHGGPSTRLPDLGEHLGTRSGTRRRSAPKLNSLSGANFLAETGLIADNQGNEPLLTETAGPAGARRSPPH